METSLVLYESDCDHRGFKLHRSFISIFHLVYLAYKFAQ